jgi:hypothetical protein
MLTRASWAKAAIHREIEAVSRLDVDGHEGEMENRSFPLTASGQPCKADVPF